MGAYVRKQRLNRVLLMPDTHRPYHSEAAFTTVLAVAEGWRPDICVIMGDFADFCEVSSHPQNPACKFSFPEEVADVNAGLDDLDRALKAAGCRDKRFLQGNHEHRLQRYVRANADKLEGFVAWADVLSLAKL